MNGMTLRETRLQILVNVFWLQTALEHHDLSPVDELRHFFSEFFVRLIFGSNPDFASFLDDLLAKMMDALVECFYGAGTLLVGGNLLGQFSKKRLKILHGCLFFHRYAYNVAIGV